MKRFTAHTYTGNTSAEDRTRGWDRIRFADESRRAYLDDECKRLANDEITKRHREQSRAAGRKAAAQRKAQRRRK